MEKAPGCQHLPSCPPWPSIWCQQTLNNSYWPGGAGGACSGAKHSEPKVNTGHIVRLVTGAGGRGHKKQPPGSWWKCVESFWEAGVPTNQMVVKRPGTGGPLQPSQWAQEKRVRTQNDCPPKGSPEPHLAPGKSKPTGLQLLTVH